ncbi:MAG: histidinol-phosphate transaminase [Devosiaceae bacterium]|nr:histidinol-phosphate transaminase [Devosiaceae bacterium]
MSDCPVPKSGVMKIAPYVPGKSQAPVAFETIKLSSNESPLGASPKAIAALEGLGKKLASYPDASSSGLRNALAQVHGLKAGRLIVGAGSDEILHLLAHAYLGAGDEAIISQYGFLMYPIVTLGAGATPVVASDRDYVVDVDAMLGAVTRATKMVFLANPNNPTGTYLNGDELKRLHQGLPKNVLLVVDCAYAEYVTAMDYSVGVDLVEAHENVVMVRTFSKMGLAALRIGWMYGPEKIVDALNRLRDPFNINMAAQLAGEAAVRDIKFTRELNIHNAKWRRWLSAELNGNAIRVLPSQGNFILVLFAQEQGMSARQANEVLLNQGIVVREMGAYGLPDALRISIGSGAAMEKVAAILKDQHIK